LGEDCDETELGLVFQDIEAADDQAMAQWRSPVQLRENSSAMGADNRGDQVMHGLDLVLESDCPSFRLGHPH
jgi:hypothetical protein